MGRCAQIKRTKFTKRCFAVMDEGGNGALSFRDFVVSCWNYCTFDERSLVQFAFDMFDEEGTDGLDITAMEAMVEALYGTENSTKSRLARKINKDMEKHLLNRTMSQRQFHGWVKKHHAILFPVFEMQLRLKEKLGGVHFWAKAARSRGINPNAGPMWTQKSVQAILKNQQLYEATLAKAARRRLLIKEGIHAIGYEEEVTGTPCVYGSLSFRREQALEAYEGIDFTGATAAAAASMSENTISGAIGVSSLKYAKKKGQLPPLKNARVNPE